MKTHWTYDDIPSQQGRIALVTGANSGLGYETALALARRGAQVVLACRSVRRGEQAEAAIRAQAPGARLSVVELDLADLHSVAACARQVGETVPRLDLLVNNAGVMIPPITRTRQGFELQFGVNHLGHFALTALLWPLIGVGPARVVSLSSIAASINRIDLDDPNYLRRRYNRWEAYCASKLADQMFIQELARRVDGTNVMAVTAHPGVAATSLFKYGRPGRWYANHFAQSAAMGALSVLRAACGEGVTNGSYWGPGGMFGMSGWPESARIPSKALDADLCRRLWAISEDLTGVSY